MANRTINWSVFDSFQRPVEAQFLSWAAADAWKAAIDLQFAPKREAVATLRAHWDVELASFGGDPHSRDWSRFRALRRHREEDWSDWLAQLIEDSETGWFAWRLLGATEGRTFTADYAGADVQREIARDGFRADVVVLWRDATYTHIEVKVGDENLEKTRETSAKMRDLFRGVAEPRADILLILPEQRTAWDAACERHPEFRTCIGVLTWMDVASSLRHALRTAHGESPTWRAWAYAFCGAIEQELLGVRSRRSAGQWVNGLSPLALETATELLSLDGEG